MPFLQVEANWTPFSYVHQGGSIIATWQTCCCFFPFCVCVLFFFHPVLSHLVLLTYRDTVREFVCPLLEGEHKTEENIRR